MADPEKGPFPFTLNLDSTSITASGTKTDVINIGSNEEFNIKELVIISATGTFSLEITDQRGIAYQQEAVHFAVNQTSQYPYEFTMMLQMPPSSTFSFLFTDTSAATNRVRMQLRGMREIK